MYTSKEINKHTPLITITKSRKIQSSIRFLLKTLHRRRLANNATQAITLSSKPELTFFKAHQPGACWFDALSRAKVALSLSFT